MMMKYGRLCPAGSGRPTSLPDDQMLWRFNMALTGHLRNRSWCQALQEPPGFARTVLGIGGEHDQEEAIFGGESKARHVEHGMVRHGKAIQGEHSKHRGKSTEQNRHLESHHDERWPRMIGFTAHVDRITHGRNPVLQGVSRQAPQQSTNQYHKRDAVLVKSHRFRQSFHWKRAVGVDLQIAGFVRTMSRIHQALGRIKFGHHSVNRSALHSFTSASGNSVRISKIEIMGRMRTNRNMAARNMPMVPM